MFANIVEEILEQRFNDGIRTEERAFYDVIPIPARAVDLVRPDLNKCTANKHLWHNLAGDCAGRNARRGLARRLAAAAALVAQPVFRIVGVVGVAWPVSVFDL